MGNILGSYTITLFVGIMYWDHRMAYKLRKNHLMWGTWFWFMLLFGVTLGKYIQL